MGTLAFAAIFVVTIAWAKWDPYVHKIGAIAGTGVWPGHDVLRQAGLAGASPSLTHAWSFTVAYATAVWPALVAALLISAGTQALVPRQWLLRVVSRRSRGGGSLAGGLLALPSLMCTCCTAPVAATLRRSGAPPSAALAYWLGNPVLNPAVLIFLAMVGPWQWVVTRVAAGALLVFGVTALIARLHDRRGVEAAPPAEYRPRDFPRALARLCTRLLPEYAVVVFLVGLFRGWLFPFDGGGAGGAMAVVAAALLGTLIVLPTGGEIPILQSLALAGVANGVIGTLLLVLPAISIVSMTMVARDFSPRVTAATGLGVAVTGVVAGGLLAVLA